MLRPGLHVIQVMTGAQRFAMTSGQAFHSHADGEAMSQRKAGALTVMAGAIIIMSLAPAPLSAQTSAVDDGPRFALLWLGTRIDSLYQAEHARVRDVCASADTTCFIRELDTTPLRITRTYGAPDRLQPLGWLAAGLRTEGPWPYARLLHEPDEGAAVELMENVGDWGYGLTLPLMEVRGEWVRPAFPASSGLFWLTDAEEDGDRFHVEVFGLAGLRWYAGPLRARRVQDGAVMELPAAIYFVQEVERGRVRLRPTIPSDMPCDPDAPPDPEDVPFYDVPLSRLLGPDGVPTVRWADAKGC